VTKKYKNSGVTKPIQTKKVKQELFNKHFLDSNGWIKKARQLMLTAHYLVFIESKLWKNVFIESESCEIKPDVKLSDIIDGYKNPMQKDDFETLSSVLISSPLLVGFALENILKAVLIREKEIRIEKGVKITGLVKNHDILGMLKLFKKHKLNLNENEEKKIKHLTFQLQTLSRYPIAKDLNKQNEFTGVVNRHEEYYNLATKIIKDILNTEEWKLYSNGI